MVKLVAKVMTVLLPEGKFPPGSVLPESAKTIRHLADLVKRGRIGLEADEVTLRVSDPVKGKCYPEVAGMKPALLGQLFRRGQLVADGFTPQLAAAVCEVAARGKLKLTVELVEPAPAAPPAGDTPAVTEDPKEEPMQDPPADPPAANEGNEGKHRGKRRSSH